MGLDGEFGQGEHDAREDVYHDLDHGRLGRTRLGEFEMRRRRYLLIHAALSSSTEDGVPS